MPQDVTLTTLQVLSIGILICAVVWIIRPFLISITWAAMIVVATWPILITVQKRMKLNRRPATAIMTITLLLVVLIPICFTIAAIIQEANDAYGWLKSLPTFIFPPPPRWLEGIPLAGPRLSGFWKELVQRGPEELCMYLVPYTRQALGWLVAQAGNMGIVVLHFFFTVIFAAVLYAKGEVASEGIINFARRLSGRRGEDIVHLAAKAIRGVALGVIVTAIIQAIVGGIGLVVTGVRAAALLIAVMFMLCLAQGRSVPDSYSRSDLDLLE